MSKAAFAGEAPYPGTLHQRRWTTSSGVEASTLTRAECSSLKEGGGGRGTQGHPTQQLASIWLQTLAERV